LQRPASCVTAIIVASIQNQRNHPHLSFGGDFVYLCTLFAFASLQQYTRM
jgi:hypothetical protein